MMARRCFIISALSGEVLSVSTCPGATNVTDPTVKHHIFIHLQTLPSLSSD
jgi:hypothetical protein